MTRLSEQLADLDKPAHDAAAVESFDDADEFDPGPRPVKRISLRWWVALLSVVVVAAVAALVAVLVVRPNTPGDNSPEAGFARDMQQHHAQAVDMSLTVRDLTDDAATRLLAYDIATTQGQQIGQMYAWLAMWHDSQARTAPAMAWMGHTGVTGATMPGMATSAQLAKLKTLTGRPAEIMYLQLMIAHHRGGVEMAQAIIERSTQPEVVALANSMVNSQQSEIDLMESMLKERGATTDQAPTS